MRWLFFALLLVPLVEMLLLFEVSDRAGGLWTVLLVVLTAVIGIRILRQQGFSTLLRARVRLASGELPAQEIVEAMLLAAAGALLLTPGFLTDTIGFVLLSGPLRQPLARRLIRLGLVAASGAGSGEFNSRSAPRAAAQRSGTVYEGEYARQADSPRKNLDSTAGQDQD